MHTLSWAVVKAVGLSYPQGPKAYVKFQVSDLSMRTQSAGDRTEDPVWNEKFTLCVALCCRFVGLNLIYFSSAASGLFSTLSLQVYHSSEVWRDICIGIFEIQLHQLLELAQTSPG
jgi:Ca2+-dependent lipid-binding protein